jgi:hypothetical protein
MPLDGKWNQDPRRDGKTQIPREISFLGGFRPRVRGQALASRLPGRFAPFDGPSTDLLFTPPSFFPFSFLFQIAPDRV